MNLDQITWNILFEWITGTRCFLPEGCKPPAIGIAVYLILIPLFLATFYVFYIRRIRPRVFS